MLIPGTTIPHGAGIIGGPMPAPQGPPGGLPPAAAIDAMLKLAQLYRSEETNPKDLLAMERVTTLLQQIVADQHATQNAPILGRGR